MNPALVVLGAAVGAPLRYHQPGSTTPSRHAVPMGHIHGQRDRVLHPGRGSRRGPRGRGLPAGPARARRRVLRTLTTYSTLSYETLRLTEDGARFFAAANVVASIVAGLGPLSSGRQSARRSGHDNHQDRPVGDLRATPRCRTVIGRCMGGCRGWAATRLPVPCFNHAGSADRTDHGHLGSAAGPQWGASRPPIQGGRRPGGLG